MFNTLVHSSIDVVELDYVGVPANVTFTEASVQSLAVSIVDDDLVERTEVIQLLLTTLIPGVILSGSNSAFIDITDNDSELFLFVHYNNLHKS